MAELMEIRADIAIGVAKAFMSGWAFANIRGRIG
jgi:hypothetical protein